MVPARPVPGCGSPSSLRLSPGSGVPAPWELCLLLPSHQGHEPQCFSQFLCCGTGLAVTSVLWRSALAPLSTASPSAVAVFAPTLWPETINSGAASVPCPQHINLAWPPAELRQCEHFWAIRGKYTGGPALPCGSEDLSMRGRGYGLAGAHHHIISDSLSFYCVIGTHFTCHIKKSSWAVFLVYV